MNVVHTMRLRKNFAPVKGEADRGIGRYGVDKRLEKYYGRRYRVDDSR